jgi:hypothetical protein
MTTAEAMAVITAGEQAATKKLEPWWHAADVHTNYPATTGDVVALLRSQEYDCSEATICEFIDAGHIQQPGRKGGRMIWWALDILGLAGALEFRRRWLPFSKLHDWKKSNFSLSLEQAEAAGRSKKSVFEDLADFSIDDLLLLMVRADDRVARECFFESIKIKMEKA